MGKFDKFKGKGKSTTGDIVRINKYDSKAAVLDLISYIATANDDFEITPYFREILEKTVSFVKTEKEKSDFYPIDDIIDEMWKSIFDITEDFIDNLESNHGIGRINVAVGGGYSSGKSSFLNYVTGLGNLLPTGVEPVSIEGTPTVKVSVKGVSGLISPPGSGMSVSSVHPVVNRIRRREIMYEIYRMTRFYMH